MKVFHTTPAICFGQLEYGDTFYNSYEESILFMKTMVSVSTGAVGINLETGSYEIFDDEDEVIPVEATVTVKV